MTHTPGPWHIQRWGDGVLSIDAHGSTVASLADQGKETKPNAAFIVRACNNHAALVEALQPLVDYATLPWREFERLYVNRLAGETSVDAHRWHVAAARATLAAAEEEA